MKYVLTCRRTRDRFSLGAPAPAPRAPRPALPPRTRARWGSGQEWLRSNPRPGAWLVPFPGMCSPHSPSQGGGRSRVILSAPLECSPPAPPGAWSPAPRKPPWRSPVPRRPVTGAQPRGDHRVPTLTATCHLGIVLTPRVAGSVVSSATSSFKTFPRISVFVFRSLQDLHRGGRVLSPPAQRGPPAGAPGMGVTTDHRRSSETKAEVFKAALCFRAGAPRPQSPEGWSEGGRVLRLGLNAGAGAGASGQGRHFVGRGPGKDGAEGRESDSLCR